MAEEESVEKLSPAHTYSSCDDYLCSRGFKPHEDNEKYVHDDGREVPATLIARAGGPTELERLLKHLWTD